MSYSYVDATARKQKRGVDTVQDYFATLPDDDGDPTKNFLETLRRSEKENLFHELQQQLHPGDKPLDTITSLSRSASELHKKKSNSAFYIKTIATLTLAVALMTWWYFPHMTLKDLFNVGCAQWNLGLAWLNLGMTQWTVFIDNVKACLKAGDGDKIFACLKRVV